MKYPEAYLYSEEHEWFAVDDDGTCVVGITHFAQDELGEVVFVELPDVGSAFEAGDEIGSIESVKAVSEIFTSVAGEVVEVNEDLVESPEKINEDPHGDGWLVRIKMSSPKDVEGLLSAEKYRELTHAG